MKQQVWSRVVLLATGTIVLGWLILCGLLAFVAERELLNFETIQWLSVGGGNGILLLCCWLAAGRVGKGRLPVALTVTGAVLVCSLLAKIILFSTKPIALDIRIILPIMAAIAAALLASGRKNRRK